MCEVVFSIPLFNFFTKFLSADVDASVAQTKTKFTIDELLSGIHL